MPEYIERDDVIDLITRTYEAPEICTAEINAIHAADVAPVRRGKWNPDGSCSMCGEYDNKDPFGSKFCPNCGAKMDGGMDDGTST